MGIDFLLKSFRMANFFHTFSPQKNTWTSMNKKYCFSFKSYFRPLWRGGGRREWEEILSFLRIRRCQHSVVFENSSLIIFFNFSKFSWKKIANPLRFIYIVEVFDFVLKYWRNCNLQYLPWLLGHCNNKRRQFFSRYNAKGDKESLAHEHQSLSQAFLEDNIRQCKWFFKKLDEPLIASSWNNTER